MAKKLSEYTLGEMKEICRKCNACSKCIFENVGCRPSMERTPSGWKWPNTISFTDGERRTARELIQCFGEDAEIERNVSAWYVKVGQSLYPMQPAFQSLLGQSNFTIRLEDIMRNRVEL